MKVHSAFIPGAVVLCAALAIPIKEGFNVPSVKWDAAQPSRSGKDATVELVVEGVKCQGTANFFANRFKGLPGILDITAYAADHKVLVRYDAAQLKPEDIRALANEPVQGRDGTYRQFFRVLSMEAR